jgi:hypothetical protein
MGLVEWLKVKVLSSSPSTTKKKKKKKPKTKPKQKTKQKNNLQGSEFNPQYCPP